MNPDIPLPDAPSERPQEYLADIGFEDLPLSPELRKAIAERGYTHPTPVQAKAFPVIMAGRDVIVRSKTGTGKTAAFGLPLLEQIPMGTREVKALVLCPTRELALQVAEELQALAKYRDVRVTAIYGGASMKQQEDALEAGSAIIVGTPGRVYDHIRRGNLKLGSASHAVLDEADEMLNQGFYEEVTRILDCLPKGRQVLLFSATVPEDIQRLIAKYTTAAETLLLSGDVFTVEHIRHIRYELSDAYPKPRNLLYVLEMEEPENAIVFCNTRDDTEMVMAVLNRNGFDAELLNGDLPQKERERVMGKVKRGEVAYMVATDIAARGIDISDLSHVINYSLPEDPAVYLHRVGRTGRIGKKGTALNLTSGRELMTLTALERKYGVVFERKQMPTPEQAMQLWTERHVRELKDVAQGSIYEGFLGLAQALKGRADADELIAVMLRYFFTHRRMEKLQHGGEEPREARPERVEKRHDRDDRGGGRREPGRDRGGRGGREERPRRSGRYEVSEEPPAPRPTPPPGSPAPAAERAGAERPRSATQRSDRELFAAMVDSTPAQPAAPKPPPPVASPAASSRGRPSDREIYEAMQAGRPLPPMPPEESVSTGESEHFRERKERDPRRARSERGERSDRGARPPREPKSLSDTELVEALKHGAPLPELEDPTTRAAAPRGAPRGELSERPRRARERQEPTPVEAGNARVWVNLGKLDSLDEAGLASALESAGAPMGKVKKTELRGSYSYLHVADGDVSAFESLAGKLFNGEKAIKVERARR